MKNFCPDCDRRTHSTLGNPTVLDEPIADESSGDIEVVIGLTLQCADCGHHFKDLSFSLEGVLSELDLNEHVGRRHVLESTCHDPQLDEVGTEYGLEVTVEIRCTCQEDGAPLELISLERAVTEEEIEEVLQ